MKSLKKLKYIALSVALVLIAAALIIYPERYVSACFDGWVMWAECVLPSLFPFIIISLVFIKTGLADKASLPLKRVARVFRTPPAAAVCFIISICSGYPAGARALSEFYDGGCLSKRDSAKLAPLCSTSGPLFVIGSVGFKMFGDKSAGLILLLCHALSVVSVALIFSLFSKPDDGAPARREADKNALYNSFYGGVISVAVAGGFIAFFYVIGQIAADFNLLYPLQLLFRLFTDEATASALCRGLIEVTAGCRALSLSESALALPFTGFIITFGGLSILMQQLAYLVKAGVKPLRFIAVKLLQSAVCFLILLAFI